MMPVPGTTGAISTLAAPLLTAHVGSLDGTIAQADLARMLRHLRLPCVRTATGASAARADAAVAVTHRQQRRAERTTALHHR
jgi:hypothetical protein